MQTNPSKPAMPASTAVALSPARSGNGDATQDNSNHSNAGTTTSASTTDLPERAHKSREPLNAVGGEARGIPHSVTVHAKCVAPNGVPWRCGSAHHVHAACSGWSEQACVIRSHHRLSRCCHPGARTSTSYRKSQKKGRSRTSTRSQRTNAGTRALWPISNLRLHRLRNNSLTQVDDAWMTPCNSALHSQAFPDNPS